MRRVHLGDTLLHGVRSGGVTLVPVLAGIARDLDQAVVGSGPDQVAVFGRWRDGVDDAAMLALGGIGGDEGAQARRDFRGLRESESGLMILPTVAAIGGAKQNVRSEIKNVRIDGREEQRRGAH
jgi:hypothetical protein